MHACRSTLEDPTVYDVVAYPGPRTAPPCQPGILVCNGMGGTTCMGGVGPSPEVCDGIDNDCDTSVDEVGVAPDGIDGSSNPNPPPVAVIGDACGVDIGECQAGNYVCAQGLFACIGGQGAVPETCDCNDNDCNGVVDNQPGGGMMLCGSGKDCVSSSVGCQCATPCSAGEIQCPAGQKCEDVTSSETGMPLGKYCVVDTCPGGCADKLIKDANDAVICGPAGTMLPDCGVAPVCVCKGQNGCEEPCAGVTCTAGQVCANYGPSAGTCVQDNCYNVPCLGCGHACNLGSCVDNPCTDASCMPGEVCNPSDDFTSFVCIASCADQSCAANETCVGGVCVPACDPPCAVGAVCDTSASPPTCVADQCTPNPCTDGACCDPLTGQCGNCPCEGVLCPAGQECKNGDCFEGQGGAGGGTSTSSTGTGSSTGDAVTGVGSGAQTGAGSGGGDSPKGIWGLPTGGGGCACEVGATAGGGDARWLLALLGAAATGLRRRKRAARAAGQVRR